MELSALSRAPSALAGYQFIAVINLPDDDRLEHTAFGD